MADGTNRSVADAQLTDYAPPSRRALLKAAALSAAGAAGIGMSLAEGATTAAATNGDLAAGATGKPPAQQSAHPPLPGRIAIAASQYRTTSGYQFIPLDSTVTSNFSGTYGARAQLSGSPTLWTTPIYIPDRSTLLAGYFLILNTDGLTDTVQVNSLTGGVLASATSTTANPAFQFVYAPLSSPVSVDNYNNGYFLAWRPGAATSNHQILFGQAVFFNEGRFATFPNPRRVFDGTANPIAPGIYGPIDATLQVSTSGWPGGPSGVPVGVEAAFCAVQSYNSGAMTLYPDGTSDPGIANWSGTADGPLNMTYMLVPLSVGGKFRMHKYFTGLAFVDVWGYLA